MAKIKVNGTYINYSQITCEENNTSEDVVMIHGLAASLGFWGFHHAPVFSKRYRVTIFDLRGHGRSEMTKTGYSPCNLTIDLQQLLAKLGIRKAHFIAHSFGGVIALKLARLDPQCVSSITLADTHITAVRNMQKDVKWNFGEGIQPILQRNNISIDVNAPYFGYRMLTEIARRQIKNQEFTPDLRELVSIFSGRFGGRSAAQWLKLMDTTSAETEIMSDDDLSLQELKSFKFPILAVYGEHSQSMLTGKHLLDIWPHADFRVVRNGGHFFPISQPRMFIKFCEQFWNGALIDKYPRRKGDPVKSHFRSNRIYLDEGGWFFSTRQKTRRGPFMSIEAAEHGLQVHLANTMISDQNYIMDIQQCS